MVAPFIAHSIDALAERIQAVRNGKKIVFTNGCFDLLHVGHIQYLHEAKQLGDLLVVGLNSDESVKRLKGESRPIQCEEDRCQILAALRCVDAVVVFREDTPEKLIQRIRPDVLVKGGDWPENKIVGAELVRSYGGQVRSLQLVQGRSTSLIVEKLKTL